MSHFVHTQRADFKGEVFGVKLDLRPMLRGEVTRVGVDFLIEPEAPAGVELDGDAHMEGLVTNQGGYMRLEATVTVPYSGTCARCLDAVSGTFVMPFERTVVTEGTLTEEQEEDNVDEYVILEDGFLDVDEAVREALILSFPMRLLCREDCPGLCPVCGKPLRDGDCGCVKKEIDPRWAALASIRFDEDEEDDTKGK